jgi:enamine deaminase RidA (YjgF/YER057c/UK114 family)
MTADERLAALNDTLPPAPKPQGVYRPVVVVGDMAYVSGHGPLKPDKTLMSGKVGSDLTEAEGKAAARVVGLAILATLKQHFGTLNRIERLVKSLGMVNATPEFGTHPVVINGYSELMVEIFGEEHGVGARSAVGMGSLPGNIPVEIEAIFQLKPKA